MLTYCCGVKHSPCVFSAAERNTLPDVAVYEGTLKNNVQGKFSCFSYQRGRQRRQYNSISAYKNFCARLNILISRQKLLALVFAGGIWRKGWVLSIHTGFLIHFAIRRPLTGLLPDPDRQQS